MSRYMIMQDKNLSFDDISKLKIGSFFYEFDMGFVGKAVIKTTPNVERIDDMDVLRFEAEVYDIDLKNLTFKKRDETTSYLFSRGYMHYAGKCYSDIGIWDREEQKVVELDSIMNVDE